jgi:hypothetical protein
LRCDLESVAWDIGVDRSRARTDTQRESETQTQTQKKRERESCGDNGVLKNAIECAVGFGAHLRFLFLKKRKRAVGTMEFWRVRFNVL